MNKKIKTTVKKAYKAIKDQDIEAYGGIIEGECKNLATALLYILAAVGIVLITISLYKVLW